MMCRDNIWRYGLNLDDFSYTRTSGRSAPLVLVPVPHTQMSVTTPDVSHNP